MRSCCEARHRAPRDPCTESLTPHRRSGRPDAAAVDHVSEQAIKESRHTYGRGAWLTDHNLPGAESHVPDDAEVSGGANVGGMMSALAPVFRD